MARADKPKHEDLPTNDDVRDKGKRPMIDPADVDEAMEAERNAAQRVLRTPGPKPKDTRRASATPSASQHKAKRRTRAAPRPASPKGRVTH